MWLKAKRNHLAVKKLKVEKLKWLTTALKNNYV
jgi:hypothetical protein